jgi:hypothetical protein
VKEKYIKSLMIDAKTFNINLINNKTLWFGDFLIVTLFDPTRTFFLYAFVLLVMYNDGEPIVCQLFYFILRLYLFFIVVHF